MTIFLIAMTILWLIGTIVVAVFSALELHDARSDWAKSYPDKDDVAQRYANARRRLQMSPLFLVLLYRYANKTFSARSEVNLEILKHAEGVKNR